MKRNATIDDFLKPIAEAPTQAYLTNTIQVADVLEWILEQVGESKVWMSSFSISEEFLRRLFFITKSGKVSEFTLILDHKATNKTLRLWPFMIQVVQRVFLADNHSKVLLVMPLMGDMVAMVTSQNLTRGNRNESAIITMNKEIFDKLHKAMDDLISNRSVPLYDLFKQKITT